ncbi:GNAT family N-acetyltransferase, partial [Candidatus Micrarchaeota archaeon]|nr:GNAT family N-acetyltransferase [Candidatus Micrarchaeota archaeon]
MVRKATVKDTNAIGALLNEYDRHEHSLDKTQKVESAAKYKKYAEKFIKGNKKIILVAEEKGKIIGFLDAKILKQKKENVGSIRNLFVKSGYRSGGCGSKLIAEALKWFKKNKVK